MSVSLLRRACLVALLSLPLAARAEGRAVLDISGAQFKPLPLALAPLQGPAAATQPLGATLTSDLELSGLFQLLDPRSFLASPGEGLSASDIDFSKWAAVGASSLVKGQISGDARGYKVELRLFDVTRGTQTLKVSYTGKAPQLRRLAHDFANLVYRFFTGEKGIFRTRLAFVKRIGASKQIYLSDFDGHDAAPLTRGSGLNLLPAWSPDGRQVAFTSFRGGAPMLYVEGVDGKGEHAVHPEGALQTGAAFSPDGKRLAFTMSVHGNSDIWVMNVDGTGLKDLTDSREIESSPAWSPDGKRLAFVSKRSGDPQIFVMNADGSHVERLTFQGTYNQTPDWSPRGDEIAFTARDERNVFDLFTVNVETKEIKRLTQDQGNNEEPSFSPNGRHLVFSSTRQGGRSELFLMRADGTNQRALGVMDASTPAWGPWTN